MATASLGAYKEKVSGAADLSTGIVAASPLMREILDFLWRVARSEARTILLEGESGVGKDVLANALHHESSRAAKPFLTVNCAAIPETLLESELFGYERGAFTDARTSKPGLLEVCDGGTLFLDEIGQTPHRLQVKLLRALEEQRFRRLGGLEDIHVDTRLVAAANESLREAVRRGTFRLDLYYRLNVFQVVIPPLRARREDILPLAQFFVERYNRKYGRNIQGMANDAAAMMLRYDWPGNVRELRNAVERAMVLEESARIGATSLPPEISQYPEPGDSDPVSGGLAVSSPALQWELTRPLSEDLSLKRNERRLLLRALEKSGGGVSAAARLLDISRDSLRSKLKRYGLRVIRTDRASKRHDGAIGAGLGAQLDGDGR